jgi:hypothetical protein
MGFALLPLGAFSGHPVSATLVHGYANPLTIRRFVKLAESPKVLEMLPYSRIRATRSKDAAPAVDADAAKQRQKRPRRESKQD